MCPKINPTIRTYDAIHDLYDAETRDFWEKFPAATVREFVSRLHGKDVLNLGSGPGRDSIILREHGLSVTCIDGSKEMVEMTFRLGFKSIQADLRDLNLAGLYDGIWAYSSLIHLTYDESKELLEKIHNLLRPDGVLFLGLIDGKGNETRNVANSSYTRYFEYYDENKVESLLHGTGMKIVHRDAFRPGNHTYLNYIIKNDLEKQVS